MLKPRALGPSDRIAVLAPASAFAREEFEAGIAELRALGFAPVYDDSVFERAPLGYTAGTAELRAAAWRRAWDDPEIAAIIAVRGGYGSVHLLPLLDPSAVRRQPKAFIGFSDNTTLLNWLTLQCGIVSFHGPMLERRLARGEAGYDRDTFWRCLCRAEPPGAVTHPQLETVRSGEATGMLVGGTMSLITASLGTPYAFDPPAGCVLFLEDIAERPYRIDRMLTQLRLSGVLDRAAAIVFGEMPECEEPAGTPKARAVVEELLRDFRGPVLFGLPSGHTAGATLTLPFGVAARVIANREPALVIEEAAVVW
jgi:muramoyltetrapeptide carboxypeptidase